MLEQVAQSALLSVPIYVDLLCVLHVCHGSFNHLIAKHYYDRGKQCPALTTSTNVFALY